MKLRPEIYSFFTTKQITPTGWLKKQLEIQAAGLSGNLDRVWPDISDSRWIGGSHDGWERVPYWLDGFVPLAYLLKNDDMIARAQKYINAIIENQCEDGWLCPCNHEERAGYDMWALFLICKVLTVYHDCSGDERIEGVIYSALKNLSSHIKEHPLFSWAHSRWFECLISIFWLYRRCEEDWLLELAAELERQGLSYVELFDNWQDEEPRREWTHRTHVVNLSMALKSDALASAVNEKRDPDHFAEMMLSKLQKYHGTAYGHFTGDECLAGNSPIQGSELCGVAEAMYSYEQLFSITGNVKWADRLEMLAYNALPATISTDMWTHQYDQMTNQIKCCDMGDKIIFMTNGRYANMFGLEPNFGCCTANFNQAWPKFTLSTFYKYDGGIISASLAPSTVTTEINGNTVICSLDTDYPFRNLLKYTVKVDNPTEFELSIRIPAFVSSAKIDGICVKVGEIAKIKRLWKGTQTVEVELKLDITFDQRPHDMYVLRRGSLIYSVKIEEEWNRLEYTDNGVTRKYPYCDYEIIPKSKWNYAFAADDFQINENNFDHPFSAENPPLSIDASMYEINWGENNEFPNVCPAIPAERKPLGKAVKIKLIPYGCTNLRMTEIPKLF